MQVGKKVAVLESPEYYIPYSFISDTLIQIFNFFCKYCFFMWFLKILTCLPPHEVLQNSYSSVVLAIFRPSVRNIYA